MNSHRQPLQQAIYMNRKNYILHGKIYTVTKGTHVLVLTKRHLKQIHPSTYQYIIMVNYILLWQIAIKFKVPLSTRKATGNYIVSQARIVQFGKLYIIMVNCNQIQSSTINQKSHGKLHSITSTHRIIWQIIYYCYGELYIIITAIKLKVPLSTKKPREITQYHKHTSYMNIKLGQEFIDFIQLARCQRIPVPLLKIPLGQKQPTFCRQDITLFC
eukprot:TRINITY_DN12253_c0_g1_i10.p5 TRINITY_DN12253_c0_g1~~TRINITY_DN12253_c0_g1_i10.p5  ORF type:complete len:215 (+),score=-25.74 TRINITY_DN12253_c0_g1_i10:1023-1667(+)